MVTEGLRPPLGPRDVVIIGASLAGLFAAAAAAAAGARTMIIERDVLPDGPMPRKGVPQGRQLHVLLHRGLLAAEELVPGHPGGSARAGALCPSTPAPWPGSENTAGCPLGSLRTRRSRQPGRCSSIWYASGCATLPDVTLHDGVRVTELQRGARRWHVVCEDATSVEADLVIDASGRGSRLPHWLSELGVPLSQPLAVDAHLGYACRTYRAVGELPIEIAVVIAATPATGRGGLAVPVEDGQWLIVACGLR